MPNEYLTEISESFCVLPWIHMATYTDGTPLLCCLAQPPKDDPRFNLGLATLDAVWNSHYWRKARLDMLAGKKIPACRHCHKEEHAGIRSHRMNENNLWVRKLGKDYIMDLVNRTDENGYLEDDVITLDLRLGNTCNVQCVMCRPVDSSKWVRDSEKIAELTEGEVRDDWKWKKQDWANSKFDWAEDDEFWEEEIEPLLPNMRHFIFAGGEPLYLKNHKRFLKKCVESGHAEHIELRYHTNGTLMPDEILELWSNFKFVELMISIDSFGDQNTYLRYPTKWEDVKETLRKVDEAPENIYGKVLYTVHALNIFYMTDFAQWMLDQKFKKIGQWDHDGLFHPGILHYPQYMCSKVLPESVKKAVTKKMQEFSKKYPDNKQTKELENTVNFMNSEDWSEKFQSLQMYIAALDKMRSTEFAETFKELQELFDAVR
jgi:organic radical activating enzyme